MASSDPTTRGDDPAAPALPTPAALLDLVIPEDCRAGVAANLSLLADHAATVRRALGGEQG